MEGTMPNKKPDGEAAFNKLFYTYKNNAKVRGIAFRLSKKEFLRLTKLSCTYCGVEPQQEAYQYWKDGKSTVPYVYNGVDRVDNERGYYKNNVATCCGVCNNAKRSLAVEQFTAWLLRIANFVKP